MSTRGSRACERRTCSRANGGLGAQASSEPFLLCLSDAQSANETCRGCRKRATRRSGLAFSSSGSEASSLTVSSPRCTSRTTRTFLLLVMSNSEHDRSDRTSKDEARRASERVDAPRALLASHPSFGSRSSPSSSGSATARRGLLQGVLETPVTFPSRAVRSVNEESRPGRSTMRAASFCKVALSLVVHPGFIGSLSVCHQSGGFPATGPSAHRLVECRRLALPAWHRLRVATRSVLHCQAYSRKSCARSLFLRLTLLSFALPFFFANRTA